MSGIDVNHGGAIAVDPAELRAVADGLAALTPAFADAAAAVRRAHGFVSGMPVGSWRVDTAALWSSADRAEALQDECRVAAENTRLMADVYELVERRVELEGLEIQGRAVPGSLHDRIAELEASDPRVVEMEKWLIAGWETGRDEGLYDQFEPADFAVAPGVGLSLGAVFAVAAAIGAKGFSRLPPKATLTGSGGSVSVTPVKTSLPIAPPTSVAEGLRRFPDAPGAQIKVERYTMADGSNKFVLYSKGTQAGRLLDPKEPFDMRSNLDLYSGHESASYAATVEALKASGAQAGDEVQIYAHSQGAMNAAYLSSSSDFDVTVQVTAGSPVQPTLDDDQLLIALRHTDDMVNSLAGGGLPSGSGSPDSIVVTRVADPTPQLHDLGLHPHLMRSYTETAEMLDASGDPRLEAWRDRSRELTDAVSIEATEYEARRE